MKKLFLLRHGNAPRVHNESDSDRKLNELGYKEAAEVAEFLNANKWNIDLIKSSDSIRTRQTVSKLLEYAKTKTTFSRELYNASGNEILEEIKNTSDSVLNLLVVGHNPGITSVLDLINPASSSDDAIGARNYEVTCKLVVVECDLDQWSNIDLSKCSIKNVFFPSNYN